MADLSEFEAAQSTLRRSGYASWYERVMDELDDDRKASLDAALKSPHLTPRAIRLVLADWGYDVSLNAVQDRRRKLRG